MSSASSIEFAGKVCERCLPIEKGIDFANVAEDIDMVLDGVWSVVVDAVAVVVDNAVYGIDFITIWAVVSVSADDDGFVCVNLSSGIIPVSFKESELLLLLSLLSLLSIPSGGCGRVLSDKSLFDSVVRWLNPKKYILFF